jgi:hypothetical protein
MGAPGYGINLPPATRILQTMAPDEGSGLIHQAPHEALRVELYPLARKTPPGLPRELARVYSAFKHQMEAAATDNQLPQAEGIMIVEDWQAGLKKMTLRIVWGDPGKPPRKSQERAIYLHKDRRRAS